MQVASSQLLFAALATAFVARPVLADCFIPEPQILWSYPSEGEQRVPVDASIWVLSNVTPFGIQPSIKLNGAAIALSASAADARTDQVGPEQLRLSPGPLAPDTDYTLELRYRVPDRPYEDVFELHFHTGAHRTPKAGSSARVVAHASRDADAVSSPCREITATQGCFDTVESTPASQHIFELSGAQPLAWLLRGQREDASVLWPAQCGQPRLLLKASLAKECFSIQAIDQGGQRQAPLRYCSDAAKPGKRLPKADARNPASLRPIAARREVVAAQPTAGAQSAKAIEPAPSTSSTAAPHDAAPSHSGCAAAMGSTHHGTGWLLTLVAGLLTTRARRRRARGRERSRCVPSCSWTAASRRSETVCALEAPIAA